MRRRLKRRSATQIFRMKASGNAKSCNRRSPLRAECLTGRLQYSEKRTGRCIRCRKREVKGQMLRKKGLPADRKRKAGFHPYKLIVTCNEYGNRTNLLLYINKLKLVAKSNGKKTLVLISREIHNDLNLKSRYPMVCNAMRQCMEENDVILFQPPKGNSSTLGITGTKARSASAP